MLDLLEHNATLRLFLVIGAGYVLGSLRVRGFSLGIAGVLFAGVALGAAGPGRFELPPLISTIGLALFVYTMGLASGPGAVASLRRHGLRLSLLVCTTLLGSALFCLQAAHWFHLPPQQAAGLFCGALTNTPALAAQLEWMQRNRRDAPEAVRVGPAVGYSLAYPFGVVGLLALMSIYGRRVPQTQPPGAPVSVTYHITQRKPNGNALEADWVQRETGMVVSRRYHSGHQEVAVADSVLEPGDLVSVVGTPEQHERYGALLGKPAAVRLEQQSHEVQYKRFFVSNRALVGSPLGDIALHGATVTRVRRGDVEITARPDLRLEWGDVVRVVAPTAKVDELSRVFGDSLENLAHSDLFPMVLGLVLGVLAGSVPLPLGAPPYPSLGVAGGSLVVGLVLGYLGRTGPVVWTLPLEANLALRQIGLLFFLAPVGIMAGGQFAAALSDEGGRLLLVGALLTTGCSLTIVVAASRWLGLEVQEVLGVLAGVHTQPAALAYATELAGSAHVEVAYSAVFPIAMIAKILLGTWLVGALSSGV